MHPRYNRIKSDHEKIIQLVRRSPLVKLIASEGDPPEKYVFLLKIKSIVRLTSDDKPQYDTSHELGIFLPPEYPRRKPACVMLTTVFHPNIAPNGDICIGDVGDGGYSPSMGLDDLVIRIINMLRYENIGLNSPYNLIAADWTSHHKHLFPLETGAIFIDNYLDLQLNDPDDSADIIVLF
jgi:ubiquitin-protein ligase